jgi:hypothetical protein
VVVAEAVVHDGEHQPGHIKAQVKENDDFRPTMQNESKIDCFKWT